MSQYLSEIKLHTGGDQVNHSAIIRQHLKTVGCTQGKGAWILWLVAGAENFHPQANSWSNSAANPGQAEREPWWGEYFHEDPISTVDYVVSKFPVKHSHNHKNVTRQRASFFEMFAVVSCGISDNCSPEKQSSRPKVCKCTFIIRQPVMSVETHFALGTIFNCDSHINQHWSVTTESQPCCKCNALLVPVALKIPSWSSNGAARWSV